MLKSTFSTLILRVTPFAASIAVAITAPSCGGGGGDSDTSPATIRPKTLDDLAITWSEGPGPRMVFLRAANSPRALNSGDTETGTLTYSFNEDDGFVDYVARDGIRTNCFWVTDLIDITYEYTAINPQQARLTVFATPGDDEDFEAPVEPGIAGRPQSAWWIQDSNIPPGPTTETVFDLSFTSDGASITLNPTRVIIPTSPLADIDNVQVEAGILTRDGALVPENYNPSEPSDPASNIAQPYLNGITINFDNDVDPTFDFTGIFAATAQVVPSSKLDPTLPDEEGLVNIQINDGTPQIDGANYTYRRINGTDDAILTLSGTGTTLDGTFTLEYEGLDNGNYIGETDGDTSEVTEVIGTFLIPSAPEFTNPPEPTVTPPPPGS